MSFRSEILKLLREPDFLRIKTDEYRYIMLMQIINKHYIKRECVSAHDARGAQIQLLRDAGKGWGEIARKLSEEG